MTKHATGYWSLCLVAATALVANVNWSVRHHTKPTRRWTRAWRRS